MVSPASQKIPENTRAENDVFAQIEAILSKQDNGTTDTSSLRKKIAVILDDQASNKHKNTALHYIQNLDAELYLYLPEILKQDPDIIRAALKAEGRLIDAIPVEYREDISYLQESLQSMSKKSSNFWRCIELLEQYRSDEQRRKTLWDFFQKSCLKNFSKEQQLIADLYFEEYETFLMLRHRGFFWKESSWFSLPKDFLKLLKNTTLQELQKLSPWERTNQIQTLLREYLQLSSEAISKLFSEILEHISQKLRIPEADADDEENNEKQEEESDSQNNTTSALEDLSSSGYGHLWGYSTISFGSQYYVTSPAGETLEFHREELDKMSQRSLERFFHFRSILDHLDLSFLIEKHARKIMLATDVDFYAWEGMSDARILKFLNSVAKNIGIPEKTFQAEWSEEKLIGCFETLDGAKMAFHHVRETGHAGSTFICAPSEKGDYSIVELTLKANSCIVPPYNEISLVQWK